MTAAAASTSLGLPAKIEACLFDLDGVVTQTARLHAAAWKEMFDAFLAAWSRAHGAAQRPFDAHDDYSRYVDGKPRYDGVRAFLAARAIELPEGDPADAPDKETVCGLGNRKNALVREMIERGGVEAFPGSLRYLDAAAAAGLKLAIVSSSANCKAILRSCGLLGRFAVIVDGETAAEWGLAGKPSADTFLAAARELGVEPAQAAIFEDALAGVEAGRNGNFGFVIGVDRDEKADDLRRCGADFVVKDLAELLKDR